MSLKPTRFLVREPRTRWRVRTPLDRLRLGQRDADLEPDFPPVLDHPVFLILPEDRTVKLDHHLGPAFRPATSPATYRQHDFPLQRSLELELDLLLGRGRNLPIPTDHPDRLGRHLDVPDPVTVYLFLKCRLETVHLPGHFGNILPIRRNLELDIERFLHRVVSVRHPELDGNHFRSGLQIKVLNQDLRTGKVTLGIVEVR